jgi:hypothetical protein
MDQAEAEVPVRRGPGRPKKEYEPMEIDQSGMVEIPYCEPDQAPKAVVSPVEVVMEINHEKAEMERFMNEKVEVYIHPTSERNADRIFSISVQGKPEWFIRGQKKGVSRRHVFGLATARPTTFSNEEYYNPQGFQDYRYPTYTGLRYPFSVTNDTPKGIAWLDQVMKSPG